MDERQKILVVDDDEFMRMMIAEAVGDGFQITDVGSGAECLEAAARERPDVVLLDVEMPGIDGYETCRQLKGNADLDSIPVIFISAHDQIEARLRGYEAGAEDYIVKPFAQQELVAKISGLLQKVRERTQLKEMANYASQTAMTAMCSMSEVGFLLQTLQTFNTCTDYQALVEATINGLSAYGLEGAVQIRTPEGAFTRTSRGEASPLEASVIGHMAGMERILQYRNRLSITYDHVSLLISNMPIEEPDRCGRLRDHLAVLTESAEMRAKTLIASARTRQRSELIADSVHQITKTLQEIDQELRYSRAGTGLAVQDLTTQLERAYVHLALTEKQEELLAGIASTGVTRVMDAQMAESGQQDKMTAVVRELKKMLTF